MLDLFAFPRPMRVAFLVNPQTLRPKDFDNIVSSCIQKWGGRFFPIIPTDGQNIDEDWQRLLVGIDPDFIYTFVELGKPLEEWIFSVIQPMHLFTSDRSHLGSAESGFWINEQYLNCIGIEDVIPYILKRHQGVAAPEFGFFSVEQDDIAEEDRSFVLRNFGAFPERFWRSLYCRQLPGTSVLGIKHEIKSPDIVMGYLLNSTGQLSIPPIYLSQEACKNKYSTQQYVQDTSFHLVVGDSSWDWFYSWNIGIAPHISPFKSSMWIPSSFLDQPKVLKLVGSWANRCRIHPNQKLARLISYTVDEERLQACAKHLSEGNDITFKAEVRSPGTFPSPMPDKLSTMMQEASAKHIAVPEYGGTVIAPLPNHLSIQPTSGRWMIDLSIKGFPIRPNIDLIGDKWRLPKRDGIAQKFIAGNRDCRITFDGSLAVLVDANKSNLSIAVPTAASLMSVLVEEYDTIRGTRVKRLNKKNRFKSLAISSNGRYLQGVMDLFSDISVLARYMEDRFWQTMFFDMAGKFSDEREELTKTIEAFQQKKFERDQTFELSGPERERLANLILRKKNSGKEITAETIRAKANIFFKQDTDSIKNILETDLPRLLSRNVIFQGASTRCENCGSARWLVVDDLRSHVQCDGCRSAYTLKPIENTSYRLNSLLSLGLRWHGLMPLIQTYLHLWSIGMSGFAFIPPQNIFEIENGYLEGETFTDIDIVALIGDQFVLGEVKSGEQGVCSIELEKIIPAVEQLRPDKFVLSAPASAFTERVTAKIDELKNSLARLNILFQEIRLDRIQ